MCWTGWMRCCLILMTEGSAGQLKAHPALAAKADQERLLDQLVRGAESAVAG
jgi:hypothetical protein